MNEEVLLRLGFDATAVKRGTMAMMDQQRKAAMDYVSFWKKAISDREQAEIQADVRAASRANKARALLRQRHDERVGRFRQELASMRTVKAEAKNLRGVALENLQRNVVGGGGGLHGSGGNLMGNSIAMREMVVLMREASRGNWSRVPGSLSILMQSLGKLPAILGAIVNPITGIIAGAAAGVAAVYKISYGARETMRQAGEAGFSVIGYQTFLRQAGRESGGTAAAQSALGTLSQNLGQLREGDMGQLQKFRKYGIATSTGNGGALNNEQIFQNILAKYDSMGDPAKRAAMAMDMFGESYKKFIKTLNEGPQGFNAAMGRGVTSTGNMAALGQIFGSDDISAWGRIKSGFGAAFNAGRSAYAEYSRLVNPNLNRLAKATNEGEAIDRREAELVAAGKIKPHQMSQREFEQLHPDLAAELKGATSRAEDVQAELADRGKLGLSELAEQGRRLSGHIRPRQYTITARMRTAMRIDDLEAAATRAWERGDDKLMGKLRGEADAMRKASPWLKFQDQNPTRKITEQLVQANKYLADVQAMAKFVMSAK